PRLRYRHPRRRRALSGGAPLPAAPRQQRPRRDAGLALRIALAPSRDPHRPVAPSTGQKARVRRLEVEMFRVLVVPSAVTLLLVTSFAPVAAPPAGPAALIANSYQPCDAGGAAQITLTT